MEQRITSTPNVALVDTPQKIPEAELSIISEKAAPHVGTPAVGPAATAGNAAGSDPERAASGGRCA